MTAATQEKPKEGLIVVEDQPRQVSPHAPTQESKPTNLVQALAIAAADPRMDVAKVKELYAIHKEMMDREAEAAFNNAMARAQADIQPVVNNARNDHTKSTYATLAEIDKAITPIHTKCGLSISYDTETKNDADPIPQGWLRIVAWVRHSGGHKERHHIDLPPDNAGAQGNTNKTMVQAIGSTNEYGRRYLKRMIFNVSTFDDRDGNGGGNSGGRMDEKKLADHLAAIDAAADEPSLLKAFGTAWNAAEDLKDKAAQRLLLQHRDARRKAMKEKRVHR